MVAKRLVKSPHQARDAELAEIASRQRADGGNYSIRGPAQSWDVGGPTVDSSRDPSGVIVQASQFCARSATAAEATFADDQLGGLMALPLGVWLVGPPFEFQAVGLFDVEDVVAPDLLVGLR